LTYEAVPLFESQNFAEARERLGLFIAEVYHEQRLHSALGSRPLAECERWLGP
jgi:hypothetical protein